MKDIWHIISSTTPEKSFKGGTIQARAWKKVRENKMLKAIPSKNLKIFFSTIYEDPLTL